MSCIFVKKCREYVNSSNRIAIAMVYSILLVDNMLLTAVIPILPEYFFKEHEEQQKLLEFNTTSREGLATIQDQTTTTGEASNQADTTTTTSCHKTGENEYFLKENLYIGILFASKPSVQVIANLLVGPIVDRIGFDLPMLLGIGIMCLSGVLFAFGSAYGVLLAARAIQGIGSASAAVAGVAMLADRYSNDSDENRGQAIGIALGGLAMGVLLGPPFASGVYQVLGKESVFLVLAVVALILAAFQLFFRGCDIAKRSQTREPIPLGTLLCDPYILLTAVSLVLGNLGIGILEAAQPIWMIQNMCPEKWELGVAFLPTSVSYLIMVNIVALLCQKLPRWFVAMIGLILVGGGCVGIPFATSFCAAMFCSLVYLIPPGAIHGFGIACIDASVFPIMAVLVDTRHRAVYGSVYAIADLAFCSAFVIGPLYAGGMIRVFGFAWLMWSFAIVVFAFTPLLLFLRKPTEISEETQPILFRARNPDEDEVFTQDGNGVMVSSTNNEKEIDN